MTTPTPPESATEAQGRALSDERIDAWLAEAQSYDGTTITDWVRDCIDAYRRATHTNADRSPGSQALRDAIEQCASQIGANHIISGSPGPLFNIGWGAANEAAAKMIRATLASFPEPAPAPQDAQALPLTQEPKYTVQGAYIVNRASGEPIPHDEPVFIFRARDKLAVKALIAYSESVGRIPGGGEHFAAVRKRIKHFRAFASRFPERMKVPDTAALTQGEPAAQDAQPLLAALVAAGCEINAAPLQAGPEASGNAESALADWHNRSARGHWTTLSNTDARATTATPAAREAESGEERDAVREGKAMTLRLPQELYEALKQVADIDRVPVIEVVRRAIDNKVSVWKAAYEEEARKFQAETLRTSQLHAANATLQATLICPRCKVDRFKADCPQRIGCPMTGVSQTQPQAKGEGV